ncbi:MAG TPA: ATP12 family protein [Rhizomicrobium sp.]|jgi:chaperone required for assembly of F1-ATPase|nr:ATP12 family protein [Rhizomicrobium sp.]
MKRFYKDVSVAERSVLLDGKALKTPRGDGLVLPTPALAEAVAEEWRGQGDVIVPAEMPLTRLANTAIDGVAPRREEVVDEIAAFARHDHICYRTDAPAELVRRQNAAWDPLLDWAAERYGAPLRPAHGVTSIAQPEASLAALEVAVEAFDPFALAALHVVASICGSLVLALAVADRRLTAAEAFAASQIDERYQAEKWGLDAEAEARARRLEAELDAAARFMDLSRTDPRTEAAPP